MILAYRLFVTQYEPDEQFERLLAFLKAHRPAVDELSLFTEYWHHGYVPLERVAALADVLTRRIQTLHAEGFPSVGINVLNTIGHINEAWDFLPPLPYPAMVGHDGQVSKAAACPTSPEFRQYVQEKYRLLAGAHPDFIWVDDDIRLHHHSVAFGCFCAGCIERFGRGPADRPSLVAALNAPQGRDLREAWVEHNATVLEELLADIARVVHEVDDRIDIGLMTAGPAWTTYSGFALDRWMAALGGRRSRPGGGFYHDASPREMIGKAFDVGQQCAKLPASVFNVQYELENFPYQKLDKAVRSVINECTLALAAGCTGIAFNCLKDLPGALDDYDDLLKAIARHRRLWEFLVERAGDLPLVGLWPASPDRLAAKRQVRDGEWFSYDPAYAITPPRVLAEIGLPLAVDPAAACATLLPGRVAEAFSDDELRRLLAGGLLMDAQALEVLWERGLGPLAGVQLGRSFDNGVWERFTDHPMNGSWAGDGRDVRLSFWPGLAHELVPVAPDVADLAHLVGYDGSDGGMTLAAYANPLGGRVVTMGYGPWARLGSTAKRTQIVTLADWASGGRLPLVIDKTVRVTPLVRLSADGRRLAAVLFNASGDPTGKLQVRVRAPLRKVRLHTVGDRQKLRVKDAADGVVVKVPSLRPWQTVVLVGKG